MRVCRRRAVFEIAVPVVGGEEAVGIGLLRAQSTARREIFHPCNLPDELPVAASRISVVEACALLGTVRALLASTAKGTTPISCDINATHITGIG